MKEIEKLRYDLKNQRKTYFTAQQNTQSQYAGGIGASIMSKLNLPQGRQSGYTPGMYASRGTEGEGTDRSFQSRY